LQVKNRAAPYIAQFPLRCFSNHTAAVAYAGKANEPKTIGGFVVKNSLIKYPITPHYVLPKSVVCNFILSLGHSIEKKEDPTLLEIKSQFGWFFIICTRGRDKCNSAIKDVLRF
jgi:hypothetical protein